MFENSKISITPTSVIYRQNRKKGNLIVKVFFQGATPRLIYYMESLSDIYPCALFESEILEYLKDAKERIRGTIPH